MSWSTCADCGLFLTEGNVTCSCDEEFMAFCNGCDEKYNKELETVGIKYLLCDECFADQLTEESYPEKEIAKEWYS